MTRRLPALVMLSLFVCTAATAQAALITFNSRIAFNGAVPGLPVETFEAGLVNTGVTVCDGPFTSLTSNPCFAPGGLRPGISYEAVINPNPNMVLLGPGVPPGFITKHIGPNAFNDTFQIALGAANAIGFDLGANTTGSILVSVFDGSNLLIGSFNVGVTFGSTIFVGLVNDAGLIRRITLSGPLGEVIDNVAFGQQTVIPEPATLLLIGAGLAFIARRIRLRRAR
jgi:hypothetical protein